MRNRQLSVKIVALALLCCELCVGRSYYDVLGVSEISTATVITKKYRQLAKQFHPDKNKEDPKAKEKFIELSKAYEILNNEISRREYDHELRFGGNSNQNQNQRQRGNQDNEREGNSFYNFHDEEVYIFRTPDGRTYRRSARDQFPAGSRFSNDQQSTGFAYQTTINNVFGSFQPANILGWITFILGAFFLSLGAFILFMVSIWMTLHEIFPNTVIFGGVFLLLVFLFSPSISGCCGYRRKSVERVIKTVKTKCAINLKAAEKMTATDLPKFDINMLREGKICIISLNDLNEKHCLSLQHRYGNDPLLFSRHKILLQNNVDNDNDHNDNDNDHSSQNNDYHDMMALFENGTKWTLFKYPDNYSVSNLTDLNNTDSIDMWLSRLLGGEIFWTKTINEDIPYALKFSDIKF